MREEYYDETPPPGVFERLLENPTPAGRVWWTSVMGTGHSWRKYLKPGWYEYVQAERQIREGSQR